MPRSIEEILQSADQLAQRFEDYEPDPAQEVPSEAVAVLRGAARERYGAERGVVAAVQSSRAAGVSWAAIGAVLGTSGEAARQRYAALVA